MTETVDAKPQPRIIDIIATLHLNGRDEEAFTYERDAALLAIYHDLSVEEVLLRSVDDYIELFTVEVLTVPEKRGYDKVYYGEAAFKKEKIL